MNIFAERIVVENLLSQIYGLRPVLPLLGDCRQRLEEAQTLLVIIRALLFNPRVVAPLHKVASRQHQGRLICCYALIELARAAGILAISDEAIEFFDVDAI